MTTFIKPLNFIFLFFLPLLIFSCEKDSFIENKSYSNIDPELWMYFQRFEQAAAERLVDIDLLDSDIHAKIEHISSVSSIGTCYHNTNTPRVINIDKAFWSRASQLRKEMIVFHELGHCYLNLGHRNEVLDNGRCKSIMRDGLGDCIDSYNDTTREEYHDELFY